ncbi:MAG: hypothetical protein C0501_04025 [Isosphaera sp.]|nr:hypothetical protein [Isosphaera sp.]
MFRPLLAAASALAPLGLAGCAGTWDTLTSRRFREDPVETTRRMFSPEDPVAVLLADPPRTGDDRAAAMRRLKEPAQAGRTSEDQDAVLGELQRAAAADPSPVVRMEAIGALGRFRDPRAAAALVAAYQAAHGRKDGDPAPARPADLGVVPAGGALRASVRGADRFPLATGPTGYPPEWVSAIRCRAAEALGRTGQPEATRFLAVVAGGSDPDASADGDRDVRLAAIRGLGHTRQPEAVAALAQVLGTEAGGRDPALVGRTHQELVRLTGRKLPPDPKAWDEVVQAGAVVVPEPTWLENVIDQAMFWER